MKSSDFFITDQQLAILKNKYPKQGKNSHIGNMAVEIAKLYFLSQTKNQAIFKTTKKGVDITVVINGQETDYEIKGTEDAEISYNKLKVSGIPCYNALVNGMPLMRITNIGNLQMKIYIMKYGVDFELFQEPRWSVKKKSKLK